MLINTEEKFSTDFVILSDKWKNKNIYTF